MSYRWAMGLPAQRLATYDDLWSVPDHQIGEIIAGELVVSPRPAPRHAYAQHSLDYEVTGPFQKGRGGPGGWIFLVEPELRLSGEALVPDIAGWRRERMPLITDDAAIDLAPDWICEVLSPRTEARDRGDKARSYAREGVKHCWLCNPRLRTLELWRLDHGMWVVEEVFHGEGELRAEPFDAVPLLLAELWAPGSEQEQSP